MITTLGGDRLGSGKKMDLYLHNYYRSTHNLSQKWASSMASGVLYPFLVIPAMRGDKFEINLEAACRTVPTKGPLFGSYKMQVDVFEVPVRLYQAILHNNPTSIGLKMNQVKLPTLNVASLSYANESGLNAGKINNSALLKYLGLSGLGHAAPTQTNMRIKRAINAVPALGYYEIFKTYYANKQEEDAYVIGVNAGTTEQLLIKTNYFPFPQNWDLISQTNQYYGIKPKEEKDNILLTLTFNNSTKKESVYDGVQIKLMSEDGATECEESLRTYIQSGYITFEAWSQSYDTYTATFAVNWSKMQNNYYQYSMRIDKFLSEQGNEAISIKSFKLQNIDDMRMKLLSFHEFNSPFKIEKSEISSTNNWTESDGTDQTGLPYATLIAEDTKSRTCNQYPMNGLMLKTYQADIYNNWIRTEWIDGDNGIAAMTAVSTASGSFKIDALNMAEKLYDLYNRIAVSDNTYEGWQDAVYTEMPKLHIETPIYLGGMSSEVVFEEIVQTAPATDDSNRGLGTLGGRGTVIKRKGGNVNVRVSEACFIIGIVSLTPRIYYTQGNEFYLTDIFSVDDFHKPALDGIGFQNLLGERLAWWDTTLADSTVLHRSVIGKLPAWLEYMTAVDKAYGDFADDERGEDGANFMILSRRYEADNNGRAIKDASTYVDPEKYNYAFAYSQLEAQNFWVQIYSDIKARRLMSAKQIPNL